MHVLSIPPAFALSQDQTLKFITRDRAETRPRRRLSTGLRSPLSMRSAPSNPSQAPTPPRRGTARAGQAESERSLASKRHIQLSKIRPLARHGADEEAAPRFREAKSRCPKARRSGSQPHGPRPPDTAAGSPEGATDRPGKSNRSAAGNPTWRPRAPVSRPVGASPKGTALRRMADLVPRGSHFKAR